MIDSALRRTSGARQIKLGERREKAFRASVEPFAKAFQASPDCIAMVERKLGRKLEPNDVPDQNLINPADDWWQQWFSDNGVPADEAVLRRRAGIRLENQANEGHAAMAGQGFALLTPFLWQGDVAAGRLVVPFPESISARGWAYWLVLPPERRMVPKVKRFREWLLAVMEEARQPALSDAAMEI